MKNKNNTTVTVLITVLFFLTQACGCMNMRKSEFAKKQYFLNATQAEKRTEAPVGGALKIGRFTAWSGYEGIAFVYRVSPSGYESDFYNEFFSPPADLIARQTQQWLGNSKIFKSVTEDSSRITADYILEGNVLYIYGDYIDRNQPGAVLGLGFTLIDSSARKNTVVLQKTFDLTEPIQSTRPEDLVAGLDRCLEKILSAFENDLRQYFNNAQTGR